MAQGFTTAFGHDFNRKTAVEIGRVFFPFLEFGFLAFNERVYKAVIFVRIHRAVDIILAVALVISRLEPGLVEIDAFLIDNWCNCIKEGQAFFAGNLADGVGQRTRRQGTGGNDGLFPFLGGKTINLAALHCDQRMVFKRIGDRLRKTFAINGKGTASGDFMLIGTPHNDRTRTAHFVMDQADGIIFLVIRPERV